jgi:murein DD-endopeptidase MepM/ murein hydrolase activator NlpD
LAVKKFFSILIVPHDNKKIFNFKLSTSTGRILLYVLAAMAACVWIFAENYKTIKTEVTGLREKEQIYKEQVQRTMEFAREIDNLKKQMGELKNLDRKASDLSKELKRSKLPSPSLPVASAKNAEKMGIGNYSAEADVNDPEFIKKMDDDIDKLKKEFKNSRNVLADLTGFLRSQLSMINITPNRWPIRGWITSRYGWRYFNHKREFHSGLDIATLYGSVIKSAADGKVEFSGWKASYGRLVVIDHGRGMQTWYGHNSSNIVKTGQFVKKGDLIAKIGTSGHTTGPHLHYEIRINGKTVNPFKFLY